MIERFTNCKIGSRVMSNGSQFVQTVHLFWPLSSAPGHGYKLAVAHLNPWNVSFRLMYGSMLSDNKKSAKLAFEVRFFYPANNFFHSVSVNWPLRVFHSVGEQMSDRDPQSLFTVFIIMIELLIMFIVKKRIILLTLLNERVLKMLLAFKNSSMVSFKFQMFGVSWCLDRPFKFQN